MRIAVYIAYAGPHYWARDDFVGRFVSNDDCPCDYLSACVPCAAGKLEGLAQQYLARLPAGGGYSCTLCHTNLRQGVVGI